MVESNFLSVSVGFSTVSHKAMSEDFHLCAPPGKGLYKVWAIMGDLFSDQLYRDSKPEGPSDTNGDVAGGPIAYFEIRYEYGPVPMLVLDAHASTKGIPATGYDWDKNWQMHSKLDEK